VAEGLMRAAAERGIPMTIFRPDNILGDRTNGILNTSDMTYSLVRAIFKMASVPDVEIMGGIVPVDFVSDAILYLSNNQNLLERHSISPAGNNRTSSRSSR
jgi:thioester reductase-like protein